MSKEKMTYEEDNLRWYDEPQKPRCYLCDRLILKFTKPDAERRYSETGLCERCQGQLKNALTKGGF